jgi:hypothetical protein
MKRTLSVSQVRSRVPPRQSGPKMHMTGRVAPQQWAERLAQGDLRSIIELLGQQHPDAREINLTGLDLNLEQVNKLALLVAHADCPAFALNLEDATAPTLGSLLGEANLHKPLTMLNLRGFRVVRPEGTFPLQTSHMALIASLLGPGSKLQKLILDEQWLIKNRSLNQQLRTSDECKFRGLLSAVASSKSLETLSLAGCLLSHPDLKVIGKKLFKQERPCTLTTLVLSGNFREPLLHPREVDRACHKACQFLESAANARCLESLDLGDSIQRDEHVDADLLALAKQVKTLCHVTVSANGEEGLPPLVLEQLKANRQQRLVPVLEMALCVKHLVPRELIGEVKKEILRVQLLEAARTV